MIPYPPFDTAESIFGNRFIRPDNCSAFTYTQPEKNFLAITLPNESVLRSLSERKGPIIVPAPPGDMFDWDLHDLIQKMNLRLPESICREKFSRDERLKRGWIILEPYVRETSVSTGLTKDEQTDILLKFRHLPLSLRPAKAVEVIYALKMMNLERGELDFWSSIRDMTVRTASRLQHESEPRYTDQVITISEDVAYDFRLYPLIPNVHLGEHIVMAGAWEMV